MKTIYVDKEFTNEEMLKMANIFVDKSNIKKIYDEDVDIFTKEGKLLVRFRKDVLKSKNQNAFFDATYKFTSQSPSHNRGSTSGSNNCNVYNNPKVKSSIIGYFDRWAPNQKAYFKNISVKTPLEVRETRFSVDNPDKFKNIIPLIEEINKYYKILLPNFFKKQNSKAKETPFKIGNTAFTTITTNVNFQTSIHKDKGDDEDGFGNLVVIEKGKYKGGETCLPQYGIGINVRAGDMLFMDVHEWHGNLPIQKIDDDAVRMSVVCYLRTKLWRRTKGKSKAFMKKHLSYLEDIKNKSQRKTKKNKKIKKSKKTKKMKK